MAFDFVFRTGMLFWNDAGDQKIYKSPIDEGNDKSIVIDEDLTICDGLAIDWIYNHVYWSDVGKKTISLTDFDGNMKKTLVTEYIEEPRALALNPLDGWMFWSDWGETARIERSGMDGSHRSVIIEKDIKWPNGLALDLIARRIFWVDAKLHIITSSDYDGMHRRTILFSTEFLRHPFSITVFEDFIYWSDWTKQSIFRANKFTGKEVQLIVSNQSIQHPMVLHIYHPYKQPDGINQCEAVNGRCSHLCLPSPKINSESPLISCACPDNLILTSDGLLCSKPVQYTLYDPDDLKLGVHEVRLTTGTILSIFLFSIILFMTILATCYKYSLRNKLKSISFYNPVYKKKSVDLFKLDKRQYLFITSIQEEIK
ncbi:low-density lipoprotein receptor-related protein 8-like [Phymastichus coffea]|uniref:low-density lipoprotein receptor-related protein 8-like n=1 Tax=Phymastichus coffea TaxID=108790 RepID=UPI00273AA02A|nr:low-density lipoprotein receptor-related protein 8-like [Phymastichus coffea]